MPISSTICGCSWHEVGPAGQVDGCLGEGVVERDQRVAEPADAGLVAQRLAQGLTEGERGVLDRVVSVDLEVALGPYGQVEQAVLADLLQHVVEERHAGVDVGVALTVEVDLDEDVRLLGLTLDLRRTTHGSS